MYYSTVQSSPVSTHHTVYTVYVPPRPMPRLTRVSKYLGSELLQTRPPPRLPRFLVKEGVFGITCHYIRPQIYNKSNWEYSTVQSPVLQMRPLPRCHGFCDRWVFAIILPLWTAMKTHQVKLEIQYSAVQYSTIQSPVLQTRPLPHCHGSGDRWFWHLRAALIYSQ